MTAPDLIAISAWGVMCNVWSVLLWMQHRMRRDGTIVSGRLRDEPTEPLSVTVLIPAQNEASAIGDCLDSVLLQEAEDLRVLVIDDRSDDQTAEIVRRRAAVDPRVHLQCIDALPEGWLGKSHALCQGMQGIETDWVLFLDADCHLESRHAVRLAIREADARSASLLTLCPRHRAGGFWESMLIPLCSGIIALWFGRSNRQKAAAFGNGQFLLMRRAAYEASGGHAGVRRAIIEDVPLAQAVRRSGFVTWAGAGADLVSVRMYSSLCQVVRGWSRIFVGALRSPLKIALSIGWLLAGSLLPFVMLPMLAADWAGLDGGPPPQVLVAATGLCLTHLTLLTLVSVRFWGMGGCDRRYLWLYPLSTIGVMVILADALWAMVIRRRIGWRAPVTDSTDGR